MISYGENLMAQQGDSSLPVDFMSSRHLWKTKIKKKGQKGWDIKAEQGQILTHMKYHLQICTVTCCTLEEYSWARRGNSILEGISIFITTLGGACVPVWNKPSVFTGGHVFLALGRPAGGLPIDQGSLFLHKWKVICCSGGQRRRWGHFLEWPGTRHTASLTWQAASIRMPIEIKTALWSSELEDPESRKASLFEFYQLSPNGRLSPTVINILPNPISKQAAGLLAVCSKELQVEEVS